MFEALLFCCHNFNGRGGQAVVSGIRYGTGCCYCHRAAPEFLLVSTGTNCSGWSVWWICCATHCLCCLLVGWCWCSVELAMVHLCLSPLGGKMFVAACVFAHSGDAASLSPSR